MCDYANGLALTVLFFILMTLPLAAAEAVRPAAVDYELSLSFTPDQGRLTGTAKITVPAGHRLSLALPRLVVTGTLLRDENGQENELQPTGDVLILPAGPTARTLFLSYTRTVAEEVDNLISPAGISLTSNWYPIPDRPMRYRVTSALPDRFSAICEADTFPLARTGNTVNAFFSRPIGALHFTAGPYTIHKRQVRENLFVYALFFEEDADLADGYLQAAAQYLRRYEREIGPYPYNHYVIVANRLPTGYGMPTFTLLGQTVLRLPFIKDTSLGHEIVHSWFGNSVEVDYAGGNWCEGLTAFLSDHAFREEKGEGVSDRNESITKYLSYVHPDSAIPLAAFTSASDRQAMAEGKRAVGYNRGALLFHELREKVGIPAFTAGLRGFYAANRDRAASWDDLRTSFSAAAGVDLDSFFAERLTRTDIPDLAVEDIAITSADQGFVLALTLRQHTEKPFSLVVPIRIRTMAGDLNVTHEIKDLVTPMAIPLDQRPLEFTIDPDQAMLRQLAPEELPAVWSRFLGAEKKLAILAREGDRELFQPLLDSLGAEGLTVTSADTVTNKELAENDLLFLGPDQLPARSLFGPPSPTTAGLRLDVRRNPLNPDRVAVLVTSTTRQDTQQVTDRLSHYGKYSYLEFIDGRNTVKRSQPTRSGLHYVLEEPANGGATAALSPFTAIIGRLAGARVVYVGENHTTQADHLLQLRIIEALSNQNPRLAIGMEMFPAAAQPALDRYTRGGAAMDERSFLKASDYYNVWRYDYRFYRDIINFAKNKGIPVIGLNLDRQVVSEVFKTGGTDSLAKEAQAALPQDRDLDLPGYSEDLARMHAVHVQGDHGSGTPGGFIQAQALWDETMAENIAAYLTEHPDYRMVVLAGTQHTRKDFGIPPRVSRRLALPQASVINLYNDSKPSDLDQVADYYFLCAAAELPEIPKMGLVLVTETKDDHAFLKIDQFSPHGKAAAAGLQEGDILKEIDGMPVVEMADVHIAMLDRKIGDRVTVKISRREDGGEREQEFQVELTLPSTGPPHP